MKWLDGIIEMSLSKLWEIERTMKPAVLHSMALQIDGDDLATEQQQVAHLVKDPPAIWETWVRFLGWEDPLEKSMATHSSILAWRIPMDCSLPGSFVHGVTKSWTRLRNEAHAHCLAISSPPN